MRAVLVNKAERRRRIRLSVAAWAYENDKKPTMTDLQFDNLALAIRPDLSTGHPKLDRFFRTKFDCNTGMWVHKHPDQEGLENIYARVWVPILYKRKRKKRRRKNRR